MKKIISLERSIVVACDLSSLEELTLLVRKVDQITGIGGYKIGFSLIFRYGMKPVVEVIRKISHKPIIYDHQKGGTDIPDTGISFARECSAAGVDGVILFPFGGAKTEREWIQVCRKSNLAVIVGGHMTHPEFLVKEGGFIANDGPERIYQIAAEEGISNFVVPGNQPQFASYYRQLLEKKLGKDNFVLWAPGFVAQGGRLTDCAKAAGKYWHAIVGRGIYQAEDPHRAALELTSNIG